MGASAGVVVIGSLWGRPGDNVGAAYAVATLSPGHRAFLEAGGMGLELGDGKLNYELEQILETYYQCRLAVGLSLTTDFQLGLNPGFNADRGPVCGS